MDRSAGAEWAAPQGIYFNGVGDMVQDSLVAMNQVANNHVSNSYSLTSALKQ